MTNGSQKGVKVLFAVSLLLSLLIALLNWGVVSDWGKVEVSRLSLSAHNGENMSILLYRPKTATAENPAPALICYHGNSGSARNHESWALEFARRGFVVLSPDLYGAGDSGNSATKLMDYTAVFEKPIDVYAYAAMLDYVDADNIITSGHSLGGTSAFGAGASCNAKAILAASDGSTADFGKKMAGDPEFDNIYSKIWTYTGNILVTYGDSGKFDGFDDQKLLGKANNRLAKRAEYGLSDFEGVTYDRLDEVMGSFKEGNAFLYSLDHRVHEGAFVSTETISKLLDFSQKAVDRVPNAIDPDNQVWMYKDWLGLFGSLAYGIFICALALLLIETVPYFHDIKRAPTRNIGVRGVGMAVSLVLGIVLPFIVLKTGSLGLQNMLVTKGSADIKQGLGPFHMTYANYSFAVVIAISIIGIIGFIVFALTDGKKHKLTLNDLGLTASDSNEFHFNVIWKPFVLTLIVAAIAFGLLQLQEDVLGTTYYAWFFGFKPLTISKIGYYLPYIPIWICCFVISSLTINVERRLPSVGNEALDTLLQIVFNVLVSTIVISIAVWNEWHFPMYNIHGLDYFNTFGTSIERIYGMPVGMAVGVSGSTLLFKKTRNTWLCAILMGTIAALMCVTYGQIRIYPM